MRILTSESDPKRQFLITHLLWLAVLCFLLIMKPALASQISGDQVIIVRSERGFLNQVNPAEPNIQALRERQSQQILAFLAKVLAEADPEDRIVIFLSPRIKLAAESRIKEMVESASKGRVELSVWDSIHREGDLDVPDILKEMAYFDLPTVEGLEVAVHLQRLQVVPDARIIDLVLADIESATQADGVQEMPRSLAPYRSGFLGALVQKYFVWAHNMPIGSIDSFSGQSGLSQARQKPRLLSAYLNNTGDLTVSETQGWQIGGAPSAAQLLRLPAPWVFLNALAQRPLNPDSQLATSCLAKVGPT